MKKLNLLLILLLPLMIFGQNKAVTIVKKTVTLNGKSRNVIPISLPANTLEWYYSFTTSRNNNGAQMLNLAENLTAKLALAYTGPIGSVISSTGITDKVLASIQIPPGSSNIDVYLCDEYNINLFINKNNFFWSTLYSTLNTKEGLVQIKTDDYTSYFLGIKNPSLLSAVDVSIEVVAIVGWDKEFKDHFYNGCIDGLKDSNYSQDQKDKVCYCFLQKLVKEDSSEMMNLSKIELQKKVEDIASECRTEMDK